MCAYYYSYIGSSPFRRTANGERRTPKPANGERRTAFAETGDLRTAFAVWGGVGGRENSEIGFSPLFPSLPG